MASKQARSCSAASSLEISEFPSYFGNTLLPLYLTQLWILHLSYNYYLEHNIPTKTGIGLNEIV